MPERPPDPERRRLLIGLTSAAGGVAIAAAAYPFLASMLPSERAKAAGAPVEADLSGLAPGALSSVEWRGKPVWLVRRTPQMLGSLGGHDSLLSDPASENSEQPANCRNATRSIRPELFVAVGICTHLGCSPTFRPEPGAPDLGPDWPGGFFCPCHGSKFDLAGRVFKGVPAPSNLVVPEHRYLSDSRLLIGEATG